MNIDDRSQRLDLGNMSMFREDLTHERIQAAREDCDAWRLARQCKNNNSSQFGHQPHQLLLRAKSLLAGAEPDGRLGGLSDFRTWAESEVIDRVSSLFKCEES
jgi:hypothetical protein